MSDAAFPVTPPAPEAPALTQIQRVICTFTAPTKTFNDIKRSTSWWLPFLLTVIFAYGLFGAITAKVTWDQVAENAIKQSSRFDKMTPDQLATQKKVIAISSEAGMALTPIFALIGSAVIAGILLATMNFGFGGKANFWQALAVVFYAGLPGILKLILGTIAIFAGLDPESFNMKNFAGTNVGYFLPADTAKGLMALATQIDFTTIWTLVLAAIGISIVAGTKRSSGYIAVFGWWIVTILLSVGVAVAFG